MYGSLPSALGSSYHLWFSGSLLHLLMLTWAFLALGLAVVFPSGASLLCFHKSPPPLFYFIHVHPAKEKMCRCRGLSFSFASPWKTTEFAYCMNADSSATLSNFSSPTLLEMMWFIYYGISLFPFFTFTRTFRIIFVCLN